MKALEMMRLLLSLVDSSVFVDFSQAAWNIAITHIASHFSIFISSHTFDLLLLQ